jgi:L-alanine-DL-glutamate epimerase-like enolase superfamily enzyme
MELSAMFIRSKVVKGETYYQAVEGYRDEQGRVRHRTVASLGRSATPDEAVVVARKDLRRLQARLAKFEPLASYSKQFGRRVDGLRSRMARLTQQLERLKALRERVKG